MNTRRKDLYNHNSLDQRPSKTDPYKPRAVQNLSTQGLCVDTLKKFRDQEKRIYVRTHDRTNIRPRMSEPLHAHAVMPFALW
jgi:hypothetical protein